MSEQHPHEDAPAPFGRVPPPYALAMIVCDAVYKDPATGKASLLGIFSILNAREFPAVAPQLAVFVTLTDGRGKVPIRLILVHADDEEVVFEAQGEVEFPDPLAVVEIVMSLGNCTFPRAGEYRLQFFCWNTHVIERRVLLRELGEDQKP